MHCHFQNVQKNKTKTENKITQYNYFYNLFYAVSIHRITVYYCTLQNLELGLGLYL